MIVNVVLGLGADHWRSYDQAIDLHKSIGITVLGLVLLRILWRLSHKPPPLPQDIPLRERMAAHITHFLLYLLMIGLPLSGWAHDSTASGAATQTMHVFGLLPWPHIDFLTNLDPAVKASLHLHRRLHTVHAWLGYALYALLAMHVGGALKHEWIDRQPLLKRMLP
jgi:cytochrome b561